MKGVPPIRWILLFPFSFLPAADSETISDEKPLYIIDSGNWREHAQHLTEGSKAMLEKLGADGFALHVYPTKRSHSAPDWFYANTRKNAVNARLVADGLEILERGSELPPPAGVMVELGGQSEEMQASFDSMVFALALAVFLVYLVMASQFESLIHPFVILFTIPLALVGGFWLIWLLGYELSVAVAVGFIALAGVAAEFGVIMLIYLDSALKRYREDNRLNSEQDLKRAIEEGACPVQSTYGVDRGQGLSHFGGQVRSVVAVSVAQSDRFHGCGAGSLAG